MVNTTYTLLTGQIRHLAVWKSKGFGAVELQRLVTRSSFSQTVIFGKAMGRRVAPLRSPN